jgi:hypothetical protein
MKILAKGGTNFSGIWTNTGWTKIQDFSLELLIRKGTSGWVLHPAAELSTDSSEFTANKCQDHTNLPNTGKIKD